MELTGVLHAGDEEEKVTWWDLRLNGTDKWRLLSFDKQQVATVLLIYCGVTTYQIFVECLQPNYFANSLFNLYTKAFRGSTILYLCLLCCICWFRFPKKQLQQEAPHFSTILFVCELTNKIQRVKIWLLGYFLLFTYYLFTLNRAGLVCTASSLYAKLCYSLPGSNCILYTSVGQVIDI